MKGIGNTPLLKLERLTEPGWADIYVKYEGANPTGSMKDRMALSMIEGAERRGDIKPSGTLLITPAEAQAALLLWYALQKDIKLIFFHRMLLQKKKFKL